MDTQPNNPPTFGQQVQPRIKKWYQHKGVLAVAILATFAIVVTVIYLQRKDNCVYPQCTPVLETPFPRDWTPPVDNATPTQPKWKTLSQTSGYKNYSFELKYPESWKYECGKAHCAIYNYQPDVIIQQNKDLCYFRLDFPQDNVDWKISDINTYTENRNGWGPHEICRDDLRMINSYLHFSGGRPSASSNGLVQYNTLEVSFKYPADWCFEDDEWGSECHYVDSYKSPNLYFWGYNISKFPKDKEHCDGLCYETQKELLQEQQSIANGTTVGLVSFKNGIGQLKVTCFGHPEGGDPVPKPQYQFVFYKDDMWYRVSLEDRTYKFSDNDQYECGNTSYMKRITVPYKVNEANYKPYNDFVDLITGLELK